MLLLKHKEKKKKGHVIEDFLFSPRPPGNSSSVLCSQATTLIAQYFRMHISHPAGPPFCPCFYVSSSLSIPWRHPIWDWGYGEAREALTLGFLQRQGWHLGLRATLRLHPGHPNCLALIPALPKVALAVPAPGLPGPLFFRLQLCLLLFRAPHFTPQSHQ